MNGKGDKSRVRNFSKYQQNYVNIRGFHQNDKLLSGRICDYCGKHIDPDNAMIFSLTTKDVYCSDICFHRIYGDGK